VQGEHVLKDKLAWVLVPSSRERRIAESLLGSPVERIMALEIYPSAALGVRFWQRARWISVPLNVEADYLISFS
jgi:hypothetical protein